MYNTNLHFHFTGIGGSGMSGIAEILLELGFKVSGTDQKNSSVVEYLVRKGAIISIGHSASYLPEKASLLVYSSAVTFENPEIVEAKRRGLPVVRRAEVLAELMRLKFGVGVAGSHGKTTTTTMLAGMLEQGKLDPTVIIGGQVRSQESGARVGKSEYLVAETDESDRSFLLLKPTVAIVTNIDTEHLHAYENFNELQTSFAQFVNEIPFYGLAVLCIDDPHVRALAATLKKRMVTYGQSPDAMVRPVNIKQVKGGTHFDVQINGEFFASVQLPVPGLHLMLNSLAAISVAREFGVTAEIIAKSLNEFPGVHRRTEVCGTVRDVTVINDYGHHPTEIRATLAAVKSGWIDEGKKLHVLFQPHRYSRTKDCFVDFLKCFEDASSVTVTDIYAASEEPIEGVSSQILVEALLHSDKHYIGDIEDAARKLVAIAESGDVILCLGAGSIGAAPRILLELL
jgi:UDP-N-acetylmuramate--alanine ligase